MRSLIGETPTFQSLSSLDQLRVLRSLTRGAAPSDPRLAAAAVEWAESYQRRKSISRLYLGWLPIVAIVGFGFAAIPAFVEWEPVIVGGYALILLGGIGQLFLNPFTRPKNVTRSLEASRQLISSRAPEV